MTKKRYLIQGLTMMVGAAALIAGQSPAYDCNVNGPLGNAVGCPGGGPVWGWILGSGTGKQAFVYATFCDRTYSFAQTAGVNQFGALIGSCKATLFDVPCGTSDGDLAGCSQAVSVQIRADWDF